MPAYDPGDFIKVEFSGDGAQAGEWMWVRVERCDDESRIVYGYLDSVPLNYYGNKLKVGSALAISFDNIRGHRRASDFKSNG